MCIRYALTASREELIHEFDLDICPEQFPAGYNLGPSRFLPVVCQDKDGSRVLRLQWWGLIPPWANGTGKAMHVNAKAETLPKKPSFFNAYQERRCIVPASGFFEWEEDGLEHQPNYIQPVAGTIMGLAAIWGRGVAPGKEEMDSFAILTTHANERLMPIHHRMPIVLDRNDYEAWLSPATAWQEILRLSHPCAPDKLLAYPVSPAVNQPGNNSPDVIRPLPGAVV